MLLLLLLAALAVGAYVWFSRLALAEQQLRALLAQHNIPVQELSVTSITTRSITLGELVLGEGDAVRAKGGTLHFAYDWRGGKLGDASAEIEGLELQAKLQGGVLTLGGIERAWGQVEAGKGEVIGLGIGGNWTAQYRENGDLDATLAQGLLTLVQEGQDMVLPLELSAQVEGREGTYKLRGDFANTKQKVQGDFTGSYAMATGRGTINWNTKPMQFGADSLTFAKLSPAFAEGITTIPARLSLSGKVDLAPGKWTVTPTLSILELPVDGLLAQVLGEGTVAKGSVKGTIPIRVTKGGAWRIEKSRLVNIGPMQLQLPADAAAAQGLGQHPQAELVQQALSNLQIEKLTLDVMSTDNKGGVKLDWHFIGRNPELLGGKPVDLTLAVTLNLQDMLNNLAQVKRATKAAEQELLKKK